MKQEISEEQRKSGILTGAAVAFLLLALPLAVWLDLTELSKTALRRQAIDLNSVITSVRSYYATNVVGRIIANPNGTTRVVHNYESVPGGVPIPATLSLELGRVIGAQQENITYRFVSDFPFQNRAPHQLDKFEKDALESLRNDPEQKIVETETSLFNDKVRLIAPVTMGPACVSCHNSHPESPKKDWKVGDVRGIQEVIIAQPIAANIFSFKFLLAYFLIAAGSGLSFLSLQRRQASRIKGMNRELESANDFLASLSMKISRYIPPQVYRSIFSGQKDVTIHTERKKLTIFFSDIQNFTATAERLQPELLTQLLNEYFTEMSGVAHEFGGTIDKFIGDAMLIFFGDPETKGDRADAQACLQMAWRMQHRLTELNAKWRASGIELPFKARMGINSGYCNVGNFGSSDRMDYTIIGAEANLAARLQSIAEPGGIVLSYETFALVSDIVRAHALPAITMKGISREVIPYSVDALNDASVETSGIITERAPGLELYLDPAVVKSGDAARVRSLLENALASLKPV
ncbi:adenylate/guanylate cyclase domain-containing protein [Bradyrhizobium sp. 4]|uniref:adenylate/guanylate cyclase domain-containing protein n=1 Tax=unclassified Bradyrhizobium TaxID=2631580 RepID=UPI001FFC25A6|nr:adenylate/guanylate cyclase domain-containing protein [Bradyrhizobium sp. 4]MCK1398603.1 adenylate/guanylate cyclase domain-containing protein [Bradyrhizobium sp. 39]MCK1751847.1 adenylate/guanylate cyclase domain-containing protein [Bradyrhizobium sp. 135]UPJ34610.1 adenylate/guanylate cyclase domain-containing protein [Bradyrhizobium sp. 4]